MIAATTLGTVSMAIEADDSALLTIGPVTEVASDKAALKPLEGIAQEEAITSLAPARVPPPRSQITEDDYILQEHVAPPPSCEEDAAHPTFCVYTVQPGETLSGIALAQGIRGNEYLSAVEMLAQSNQPDVVSSDRIVPGQKLRLPVRVGIVHTVFSARTLSEIAVKYGVSVEDVIAVPENGMSADGRIEVGQDILIPDPQQLPPVVTPELPPIPVPTETEVAPPPVEPPPVEPPPVEPPPVEPPPVESPAVEATETPEVVETPEPTPEGTPEPVDTVVPRPERTPDPDERVETPPVIVSDLGDRPTEKSAYGFVWPVWGPISSYFGPGHPLGIDIDLYDDPNMPIGAAKGGIVTFAGGNSCCSYGLYVIVEHGDGTSTLYGHLSQIAVAQGQSVGTGQLVGFSGATGYATGNHLHFEVRIGDNVVDPLIFLPRP